MAKMGSLATLGIDLRAETAAFSTDLNKANRLLGTATARMKKQTDDMQRFFKGVSAAAKGVQIAVAAIAGAAVIGSITKLTDAYGVQEKAVKSLNSALLVTGRYSEQASQALQKNASEIQALTTVGDEALLQATARMAQFAKGLGVDEIQTAQRAIVGLSEALGMDLNAAASALGKTVGTSTNALARYGIQVDKNASQSEKLNQVMTSAEAMFAQAVLNTDTLEGRSIQLKNAWGDLQETLGGLIVESIDLKRVFSDLLIPTINNLNNFLVDNRKEIQMGIQVMFKFGEAAVRAGKMVFAGIGMSVNAQAAAITGIIIFALKMQEKLVNNSLSGVNLVISAANKIPGVNLKGMKFESNLIKGLQHFKDLSDRDYMAFGKDFLLTGRDLLSGKSFFDGSGDGQFKELQDMIAKSQSGLAGLDHGGGVAGKAGSAAKKHVDEAKKRMDELRRIAAQWIEDAKTGQQKLVELVALADQLTASQLVGAEVRAAQVQKVADQLFGAFDKQREQAVKDFFQPAIEGVQNLERELANSVRTSERFNEQAAYVQQVLEGLKTPAEKAAEAIERLNEAYLNDGLQDDKYRLALAQLSTQGVEMMSTLEQAARGFGLSFEQAFTRAMDTGKLQFADFARAIMKDIARIALHLAIIRPLTNMLTGGLQSAFAGSVAGLSGLTKSGFNIGQSLAGIPGFANGGITPTNRPFLVGEQGPELMQLGRHSTVTPLTHGGGAAVTIVNNNEFNITNGTGEDSRTLSQQIVKELERSTEQILDEKLRERMRPGGLLYSGAY